MGRQTHIFNAACEHDLDGEYLDNQQTKVDIF